MMDHCMVCQTRPTFTVIRCETKRARISATYYVCHTAGCLSIVTHRIADDHQRLADKLQPAVIDVDIDDRPLLEP